MARTEKTVITLLVCLVVLLILCLLAKPVITGAHDEDVVKFVNNLSETSIGQKLLKHYTRHIIFCVKLKLKPGEDLQSAEQYEIALAFTGLLLAALTALLASLASLIVFIIQGVKKQEQPLPKSTLFLILLLIILNGTITRLILASTVFGNVDMQSCQIVSDIVTRGGNVYAQTGRYNYSPLWFTVLGTLKRFQMIQFPELPFHFIVRGFLCCVDLVTLIFLLLIAKIEKISIIKTAIFFYLNPISFLITGYHGQFENLAILMVVIGLFAYLKLKSKPILRTILLWIFATIGLVVKHNIFYELIICINYAVKRYRNKLLLFTISICVFLGSFVPYWGSESKGTITTPYGITYEGSSKGIILNVFGYSSDVGCYGITSLFDFPPLKYAFILALFIFPLFLKGDDIVKQCLLGVLFFLAFTTGIAIQYFILPIALGALRPSKGLLFYSLLGSLFILGNFNNVYIPVFTLFSWNIVWLGAIYWFVTEMRNNIQTREFLAQIKNSFLRLVRQRAN